MKKFVCFVFVQLLILILALPFVFSGGTRDNASAPANKIVIYTSMYEDIIETMRRELNREFPGYDIEFVYGGTGTLQARIAAEQASGQLGCDILLVAEPSYSLELKESGMLHSYMSAEASALAFDYDPDGFWYPVRISNMVLAYNPEINARNTVPNSFRDFAYDTSARGTVSMSNPLVSGTAIAAIAALKDRYGTVYFEALGRQEVMIDSGAAALQKLETGECKAAMVLEELVLQKRYEERSRLEIIYPADGAIMIPSTIMIINDRWSANSNASAAETIADWFLSTRGQNAIVDGWMHSVRAGFPRMPTGSISTDEIRSGSMPVNWENLYREKDEIIAQFEDNVTHNR